MYVAKEGNIVNKNQGATFIQAWSSPTALNTCNVTTNGTENNAVCPISTLLATHSPFFLL
jgi:hypothetical protein